MQQGHLIVELICANMEAKGNNIKGTHSNHKQRPHMRNLKSKYLLSRSGLLMARRAQ
jgi:hypothetical protein